MYIQLIKSSYFMENLDFLENTCWSGNDNHFYKFYNMGHKHDNIINGMIRKCKENNHKSLETANDTQDHFSLMVFGEQLKIRVSFLDFHQPLYYFNISFSKNQLIIENTNQLILTKIECPKPTIHDMMVKS